MLRVNISSIRKFTQALKIAACASNVVYFSFEPKKLRLNSKDNAMFISIELYTDSVFQYQDPYPYVDGIQTNSDYQFAFNVKPLLDVIYPQTDSLRFTRDGDADVVKCIVLPEEEDFEWKLLRYTVDEVNWLDIEKYLWRLKLPVTQFARVIKRLGVKESNNNCNMIEICNDKDNELHFVRVEDGHTLRVKLYKEREMKLQLIFEEDVEGKSDEHNISMTVPIGSLHKLCQFTSMPDCENVTLWLSGNRDTPLMVKYKSREIKGKSYNIKVLFGQVVIIEGFNVNQVI